MEQVRHGAGSCFVRLCLRAGIAFCATCINGNQGRTMRHSGEHPGATGRDESRREEWLAAVPLQWRGRVGGIHAGRMPGGGFMELAARYKAERDADEWLADMAGRVGALRVPVDISDSELCDLAESCARKALSMGEFAPGVFVSDKGALRARLAAYVGRYGVAAPGEKTKDGPALARMTCPDWWRRGLRVSQARGLEGAALALGYVHRQGEIYASNATVERRGQQRRRNAAALENMSAVNLDSGESVNLAALAAASVANPRIRRGELMTRIAGFENVARGLGHVAEFITLTCPSKFHSKRIGIGGRVEDNPKHSGETPREAASYLSGIWARMRAKLARLEIRPYGFRIAEPHHDGCPHWHVLLFVAAMHVEQLRAVVRDYALRMDVDEPGAAKNRVAFVSIDTRRGSAAGYVAKYVSKNIDGGGYQVQGDLEGMDAITPSHRVEAWASTWGIRQFQQVGGPPVGVWRELRRLPDVGGYSVTVEAARAAADCGTLNGHDEAGAAGNWARYVSIMGGPEAARRNMAVRLAKTAPGWRFDAGQGVSFIGPETRYGEIAAGRAYGVEDAATAEIFVSARDRWEIRRAGVEQIAVKAPLVGFGGARTRVNNCTEGVWNGEERQDLRIECGEAEGVSGTQEGGKSVTEWSFRNGQGQGGAAWLN